MKPDMKKMVRGEEATIGFIALIVTIAITVSIIFMIENFTAFSTVLFLTILGLYLVRIFFKYILFPMVYYLYYKYFKKIEITDEDRDEFYL